MTNERKDTIQNTVIMALLVSLVCSVLVSGTVTLLRPVQRENQLARSSHQNILPLIEAMQLDIERESVFRNMDVRAVDLATGKYSNEIDVSTYHASEAVKDPALKVVIPESEDVAGIGQRSRYAVVYLINEGARLKYILLPVYGKGMWSILYGYIALEGDGNTIAAIKIHEHGETPGIGDKVDDPAWLQQWKGKLVYENNNAAISVIKRRTTSSSPYEVDAITGATLTSQGVSRSLQYWLGKHGFQLYLTNLKEGNL